MLREYVAIESRPIELSLSDTQVRVLQELGKKLSSHSIWWGGAASDSASVVEVGRLAGGRYSLRFRDVVGVIRLGELQISVRPKIADAHFLHVIRHSDAAPRLAADEALVEVGADYSALLANWCVKEAEELLRRGLAVDYSEFNEQLEQVRGKLDVVGTASAVLLGRAVAVCEFEELGDDTPLNRIVKAACRKIAGGEGFALALRRRASSVVARMSDVGLVTPADRSVRLSRLTLSYARCLPLAKLILAGHGLRAQVGSVTGTVFLMRTPELVEAGLRNLLRRALPQLNIRKKGKQLESGGLSMNPDLVFGSPDAVGDVKYRVFGSHWDRSSLYQGVTFATAFRVQHCGVFGFLRSAQAHSPRTVRVGPVIVEEFGWLADANVSPRESQQALVARVAEWAKSFGGEQHDCVTCGASLSPDLR